MNYLVSRVLVISILALLLAGCGCSQEEQSSQGEQRCASDPA
jgi:PBP1b-binding outer membrane lipoprotein LpoB